MSSASVSIDRSLLSLSPLIIGDAAADTYCLTPEGLGDPAMVWRFVEMPNSGDIHGREIVGAALEVSSIPLEVIVSGANAATLASNVAALQLALSQFTYVTTVTVDGVSLDWTCDPGNWAPSGGVRRHDYQDALVQLLTITIPVYPVPA